MLKKEKLNIIKFDFSFEVQVFISSTAIKKFSKMFVVNSAADKSLSIKSAGLVKERFNVSSFHYPIPEYNVPFIYSSFEVL